MTDEVKNRLEQIKNCEVPKGYQNKYGYIIPTEWNTCKFSDKFTRITRKNVENNQDVLTISAQQGLIRQDDYYNHSYASENKVGYCLLNRGDFSYNKSYSGKYLYGAIKRLDRYEKGIVSPLYICFRKKEKTNSDYYLQYFELGVFNREIYKIAQEGARNHGLLNVSVDEFFSSNLLNPPIIEQEKIARILNCCDDVIKLKEQLIVEERKQKNWLMQNLLNPDSGVRLDGFNRQWKEKTMGELFEFGPSLSAARQQLGKTGICYLHYGDIHSNTSGVIDVQRDFNSIPKLLTDNILPNVLLNDGDVVFVDASEDYEGASKYVVVKNENAIPFIAGLHTIAAKSKSKELILEYKRYCFQSYSIKKQISFYISGMKVFGLSKMNIAKIVLKYPCTEEQIAIANILSTAECKIKLLELELEQWQLKKKSLMQLLLTGIVRV